MRFKSSAQRRAVMARLKSGRGKLTPPPPEKIQRIPGPNSRFTCEKPEHWYESWATAKRNARTSADMARLEREAKMLHDEIRAERKAMKEAGK